jgi:hypothetical protein
VTVQIELAILTKDGGPLTKKIRLVNGKIVSDASARKMARGAAKRARFDTLQNSEISSAVWMSNRPSRSERSSLACPMKSPSSQKTNSIR